jgi:sphinganine-1-phosphate aldolase
MEEQFLKDLKDSVALVKSNPNAFPDGLAPMYGMAASLPDRSIISDIGKTYLDAVLETQK